MREPHDIPALESLRSDLLSAAERVEEAPGPLRARWRSWRRARRVSVIAVALVASAGAVAGAAELISVGEPLAPVKRDVRDYSPPAGAVRATLVAPDPQRGLDWGIGAYARGGKSCALVGQVRAGALGLEERGRFRPLAPDEGGACGDLEALALFYDQRAYPGAQPRTLIFGRVRSGVDAVRIVDGADRRDLRPGPDGVFLAVFRGAFRQAGPQVFAMRDGRRVR